MGDESTSMKTYDMKRWDSGMRWAASVGAVLALALLTPACSSECETAADCVDDKGNPPAGQDYVCRDEKCVLEPIDTNPGRDGGTDGGSDAGTDGGDDAGTDGGDPCATASYDPKLGTLRLESGFVATDVVALSGTTALAQAVTPAPGQAPYPLVGLKGVGVDLELIALGTWPQAQLTDRPLYDVVAPADQGPGAVVFPGGYVAHDGKRVLTGYTKPGATPLDAPGQVLVYDLEAPETSTYLSAPGNFTAAAFLYSTTTAFLINGEGLGETVSGRGIYGLLPGAKPFRTVKVATFPESAAANGYTAVANNGIALLGFAASPDYVNQAYVVPPALVDDTLTSGTPLELSLQLRLDLESNYTAAASFGNGVAVLRGSYDAQLNFTGVDVARIPLSYGIGGPRTVTPGPRAAVLSFLDQCTQVQGLSGLGPDLLVTLADAHNGRRLVRIQQSP